MFNYTVSGIIAQDARLVRVKDRDYLSVTINASRPKEDAVWVTIMYGTKSPEGLQRYLVKGARIIATGTLDITHFVGAPTDDLP